MPESGEALVIREWTESDLPWIERIEAASFSCPWPAELLKNEMNGRNSLCLAVLRGGEIAGYACLYTVMDEAHLSNFAVAPEARRGGVASALMEALISRLSGRHIAYIMLEVRESNEAAVRLYKKYGFVTVGRRRGYYDLPKEDALLMTLNLKG